MVKQCPTCARHFSPRREPMIPSTLRQYPWQKIGVDLCHLKGHNYLIVVDYFSRYPEALKLPTTSAAVVIATLKSIFGRFGIPKTVVSDNGPQFHHNPSVSLRKTTAFNTQLVVPILHRAMDRELLMGRKIRTNIPLLQDQLIPEWNFLEGFCALNESFKRTQKETYDRQHAVRNLPPLSDNTKVWITSGEQTSGTVVRAADTPRSYIVDTPSGELRRNQHHLNT